MTDRHETRRRLRARSRARSVVAYILLVGLPAAGVLLVLGAGRQLAAPPNVAGEWRVENGATCGLGTGDVFEVVQSGRFIQIEIAGRPPLEGRFDDLTLRASGRVRETSAPGCREGRLSVRFRLTGDGSRLEGTGGVDNCSACPPRPISAVHVMGS
jgi:hypothetical protein